MVRAMAADFFDIAFAFDGARKSADVALGDDADLLIDDTPATPMLVSLFSDRRAKADDELPDAIADFNAPTSFVKRRGWVGDAVDADGERRGSRLWLLNREKQTEMTRRRAEIYAAESLAWALGETGAAALVEATWLRRNTLGLRCVISGDAVSVALPVAG